MTVARRALATLVVVLALAAPLSSSAWAGGSARPARSVAERARAGARPERTRAARPRRLQSPRAAAAKFRRVEQFSERLPHMRRVVTGRLSRPGLDRETAVAAIVRIMDTTYMRVGSERYARKDKPSFGASSLRKDQVRVRGDQVSFDFAGKSGVHWVRSVRDPALARTVKLFLRAPGERLFQTRAGAAVTEADVRSFLRDYGAKPKDFRTLHANRLLDLELARTRGPPSEATLKGAIQRVAAKLGHSPAVSRSSYLDPRRIDRYLGRPGAGGQEVGRGRRRGAPAPAPARRARRARR